MIKKFIKHILLRWKGIKVDLKSNIPLRVRLMGNFCSAKIVDSFISLEEMGNGCSIEHVTGYGPIRLGKYVSISGPGTTLHAVNSFIQIGSYSSIAQNVCINEFNHNMKRATTKAMHYYFFSKDFRDDFVSKGPVIIGEDVWIGSNVSICSGVTIGRGAVISAGSVITKDVPPYSVMGGVNRIIKMRFSPESISILEESKWWEWSDEEIKKNIDFFTKEFV